MTMHADLWGRIFMLKEDIEILSVGRMQEHIITVSLQSAGWVELIRCWSSIRAWSCFLHTSFYLPLSSDQQWHIPWEIPCLMWPAWGGGSQLTGSRSMSPVATLTGRTGFLQYLMYVAHGKDSQYLWYKARNDLACCLINCLFNNNNN